MLSSHESLGDINRVSGIGAARDEHFLIVSSRYISKRIHYRERSPRPNTMIISTPYGRLTTK